MPHGHPIGSPHWWQHTPIYGERGLVESVVRLRELNAITRAEAVDLIEYATWRMGALPEAPWRVLRWDD